MLNDDEIVASIQEESDLVDDKTDEDEDNNNESNKGPSNANAFSMLDSYGVVRTTIKVLSYSTTTAQENQRPFSKKTKVYNGTVTFIFHNKEADLDNDGLTYKMATCLPFRDTSVVKPFSND
ncbi:hypothetical protein TNCV_5064581 [Trichonephila clavipes]|nr:hypothetical protein TNCV_5064581 [Trichonephila clavipes]